MSCISTPAGIQRCLSTAKTSPSTTCTVFSSGRQSRCWPTTTASSQTTKSAASSSGCPSPSGRRWKGNRRNWSRTWYLMIGEDKNEEDNDFYAAFGIFIFVQRKPEKNLKRFRFRFFDCRIMQTMGSVEDLLLSLSITQERPLCAKIRLGRLGHINLCHTFMTFLILCLFWTFLRSLLLKIFFLYLDIKISGFLLTRIFAWIWT